MAHFAHLMYHDIAYVRTACLAAIPPCLRAISACNLPILQRNINNKDIQRNKWNKEQ